jgi:hypothetical protein
VYVAPVTLENVGIVPPFKQTVPVFPFVKDSVVVVPEQFVYVRFVFVIAE